MANQEQQQQKQQDEQQQKQQEEQQTHQQQQNHQRQSNDKDTGKESSMPGCEGEAGGSCKDFEERREECTAAFDLLCEYADHSISCRSSSSSATTASSSPERSKARTTLTQDLFRKATENLGIDYLQEAEVHRIWKRIHNGRQFSTSTEIDRETFLDACLQNEVLFGVAVQIKACAAARTSFKVPEKFDYQKSTSQNYRLDELDYFGSYQHERQGGEPPASRDYSYHNNYSKRRQLWQDHVVRLATVRHNPQPRPWIVFTCGAMGCGKGYTFHQLSRNGHFPIETIVRIDPDFFRVLMPEWQGYVEHGQEAGSMTHSESSFIAELCQEAALQRQQNIWVDGSLRDGEWYAKVFDDIRRRHPNYRIGIIHVHASEDVVRKRIAQRAEKTGRHVPEDLIKKSLKAPRDTLFELEPRCDWVARINNETTPHLVSFQQHDRTGNWGAMSSRWARVEPAPHEFPNSLAPIALGSRDDISLKAGFDDTSSSDFLSKGGPVEILFKKAKPSGQHDGNRSKSAGSNTGGCRSCESKGAGEGGGDGSDDVSPSRNRLRGRTSGKKTEKEKERREGSTAGEEEGREEDEDEDEDDDEDACEGTVFLSPLSFLGISGSATGEIARRCIGIDDEAVWIASFVTQFHDESLKYGGLFFFDKAKKLVKIMAIEGQCSACLNRQHFLEFFEPVTKDPEQMKDLLSGSNAKRWCHEVSPELRSRGARKCLWVCPGELDEAGGMGALVYEMKGKEYRLFAIRVPSS